MKWLLEVISYDLEHDSSKNFANLSHAKNAKKKIVKKCKNFAKSKCENFAKKENFE